jgi:hypothetical protein
MPVIPTTWEMEVGGSQLEASPGNSSRPYLKSKLKIKISWVPVAHACNLSCSGGRDQEGHDLKPAQANSLRDSILKKPISQKGWWSGSR